MGLKPVKNVLADSKAGDPTPQAPTHKFYFLMNEDEEEQVKEEGGKGASNVLPVLLVFILSIRAWSFNNI